MRAWPYSTTAAASGEHGRERKDRGAVLPRHPATRPSRRIPSSRRTRLRSYPDAAWKCNAGGPWSRCSLSMPGRRTGERDARAVAWVEAAPWPTLLWPTEPIGERNRRGSVMENRGPAGDDGLSSAPGRRGLSPELRRTTHGLLSGFTLPPLRSTGQSVVAPDEVLGPAERSPVAGGLANVDERRRTQRHLIGAGPPGR